MSDILQRLRLLVPSDSSGAAIEAADTIAALRAKVERLERALHYYADFHEDPNDGPWGLRSDDFGNRARAALGDTHE